MFFYPSQRVGKNGKPFVMWKIRTLKEGNNNAYTHASEYTWCGKFLRTYRLDELPQFWNLLKGDMRLVGIRPLDAKTAELYPSHMREKLLSIKPGWFSLSGIHFIDEENILSLSSDPAKDYWERIMPMKLTLDFFYLENRGILLDLWIIYRGVKKALWR